jgi:hypothetical protein
LGGHDFPSPKTNVGSKKASFYELPLPEKNREQKKQKVVGGHELPLPNIFNIKRHCIDSSFRETGA